MAQFVGCNLVNAKRLKTWRVDQRGLVLFINPIQIGGGGGVFARIEGLRYLLGGNVRTWDGGVDEGALAHALGPQNQGHLSLEGLEQEFIRGMVVFQRQGK